MLKYCNRESFNFEARLHNQFRNFANSLIKAPLLLNYTLLIKENI
jgi:hypothetical protein